MKELDCQKLVVDVVRANGGAAHKLSHRFLVGVCDLLVKFPSAPATLLEAKLAKLKRLDPQHTIELAVTVPQIQFLRAYRKVGMRCGVLSFIQYPNDKGHRVLKAAIFDLDTLEAHSYCVMAKDHFNLLDSNVELRFILENFCCG